MDPLKLLCVFAHPDDETLGMGGVLARYADEGVQTYLLTATRGDQGWFGDPNDYPGIEALSEIREKELRAAARVLGIQEVRLMDYCDGQLDEADPGPVVARIAAVIREVCPQVIVTFGPDGIYGHPDHIAISQLTSAAVLAAADSGYTGAGKVQVQAAPHRTAKFYYLVATERRLSMHEQVFGDLAMMVDGQERRSTGWPFWAVTTVIETREYWQQVWEAVTCHSSQLPGYESIKNLPQEQKKELFGVQEFYRAFSLVNGGRSKEADLFEGLSPTDK